MTTPTLNRILYVEDEADIQAVAQLALEAIGGFSVTICISGKEAVHVASELSHDLILLDVMMPDMDGPSTLKALRGLPQTAATPVIFMTAKVQPHEVAQYKALGAIGVIAKPFDPMKLSAEVGELWNKHTGN